jgi:hypothetical protein
MKSPFLSVNVAAVVKINICLLKLLKSTTLPNLNKETVTNKRSECFHIIKKFRFKALSIKNYCL